MDGNERIRVCFSGRSRLEPTAIVILSVVMSIASFQLIVESIQIVIGFAKKEGTLPSMELPTILIAVGTIGVVMQNGIFLLINAVHY